MTQQLIQTGTRPNDGTGDTLRTAAAKINENFAELYASGYVLPTATTSVLGGVKVDGTTVTVLNGVISAPQTYTLPTATTNTLGGVKVDGSTITANGGIISATYSYTLPAATTNTLGGVKVDGTTITINNGVISGANTYTLPTATTSVLGGVKVDGTSVTISNGVISAPYSYTLPTATSSVLGGVKVDNSTISITDGIISTVAVGRTTVSYTTGTLAIQGSTTATVVAAKGYALYSIQTTAGAWVTVYTSSTAQTNDSGRSISTDPTPGSGVIAESITTSSGTTYFTPAVYGYNSDGSVSSNMYLKIYNNSGSTQPITVTITYLKLEN